MKISDKINAAVESGKAFFSFEYFPPKTEQGLVNLYDRIERMAQLKPLFVAITWGAGGVTSERTLELCKACKKLYGLETLLHLTCTNIDRATVDKALATAKSSGICNILALRGDPPRGQEYWTPQEGGFEHARDLVEYIRQEHGDYFCIGVAGYPEGHIENKDKEQDFAHFKAKVDAGADFVVSQLVYDPQRFVAWERKCRAAGIGVPIVPGVLPVQSYQSFRRLAFLTKVDVPEALRTALEDAKTNDQAVKDLGVAHAVETVRELQRAGVCGVHLTTLNLENSVRRVVAELGIAAAPEDSAPELHVGAPVARRVWDEFPNGRWGDARSPAFGTIDAYGAMLKFDAQRARAVWGAPTALADITRIFVGYVGGSVPSLPWSDEPLRAESAQIRAQLERLNALGYWTLASQPAIDGVPSSDAVNGWGPRGGYVYQKAFVECFVNGDMFPAFLSRLQSAAPRTTYYASNLAGDFMTNAQKGKAGENVATALTWGVFPGRAVVQSTLIDRMNFLAWRTEAFQAWREWAQMFGAGSAERAFLERVYAECWLVNVVDNDYKDPDAIWDLFE